MSKRQKREPAKRRAVSDVAAKASGSSEKTASAPTARTDRFPSVRPGEEMPEFISSTDVYGSYTGNPLYGEQPIQDADDL